MAPRDNWEAKHRARVQHATRQLRARLERSGQFAPPLPTRTIGHRYPQEPVERITVPSYRCLVCQKEAESGVLLPGSIVFYFCEEHRISGQHLAENAWRRYQEKRESERIRELIHERTEKLWSLVLRGLK